MGYELTGEPIGGSALIMRMGTSPLALAVEAVKRMFEEEEEAASLCLTSA